LAFGTPRLHLRLQLETYPDPGPGRQIDRRAWEESCIRRRFKVTFTQLIGYEGKMA